MQEKFGLWIKTVPKSLHSRNSGPGWAWRTAERFQIEIGVPLFIHTNLSCTYAAPRLKQKMMGGGGGEGEGSELIMGVIHWTKISGNFSPRLNGSVQSNRKSFENTGPLFEVDHFSWWDWSEFWLSGSHLIFSLLSLLAFIPHPLDPCLFHPRFSFPAVVSLTTKDKTHQKKKMRAKQAMS